MTQEPSEWRRALPRACGLLSLWLIVVCSLPAAVLAQAPAFLVKDIDLQPVTASSNPSGFLTVGSTTFFLTDTDNGNALWTTDGSERGTVRVKDFTRGPDGQSPYVVAATHGKVILVAWDESSGYELWASDGTEPGTLRLADISPGPGSPLLNWFTEVDGTVFFFASFFADDGTEHTQLWKTDGTTLGTVLVAEKGWATPWGLIDFDGTLVFASQTELWESDGTSAGTMRVVDFPVSIATLTVAGNVLFTFTHAPSGGFDLWKSDSTAAGTVLLKSPLPYPDAVAEMNDSLFFTTWDYSTGGVGLWKSDGTPTGTVLVKDFAPVGEGPVTVQLSAVNGSLFLVVQDGMTGAEFWKSDGTSPGTVRLKGITGPEAIVRVIAVNGRLFTLFTDAAGVELWRTDGTEDGTLQLASVPGSFNFVSNVNFFDADGRLFFVLRDQLWTSDGTPAGTVLLTTGNPSELASANGQFLFAGRDSRSGVELWKTDGTPAGTMLLANLAPDTSTDTLGSNPSSLTNVNGTLLFLADDGVHGMELWRSDATASGTALVKDINPGLGSAVGGDGSGHLTPAGDTLFFLADDGVHGMELWRSDGTASGTALVRDINPGLAPAFGYGAGYLTPAGDMLFFVADDGTSGGQLWKSDGTEPGTVQLTHCNPDPYRRLRALTVIDGRLYFLNGPELWTSDGTEPGTIKIADAGNPVGSYPPALTGANGVLYFLTYDSNGASLQLWSSDGSAAGTMRVAELPGDVGGGTAVITAVNGTLFIAAPRAGPYLTGHTDLWKSDGSAAGTMLVTTIESPNDWGITADEFTAVDDMLFFMTHSHLGYPGETPQLPVLWRSDGTAAGTVPVASLPSTYSDQFFVAPFDGGLVCTAYQGALFRADRAGGAMVKDLLSLSPLVDAGGRLLFQACASYMDDCGLWESDRTADGTRRLAAVPGGEPTVAGAFAFFSGASGSSGTELWAVPIASLGHCSNGVLDPGEACDTAGASATCQADCTTPTCGDAIVNQAAGEECDDGNTQNGDCCSDTCTFESSGSACGDGSACNGEETCDGAGTCQPGIPAPAGTPCGYGNICAGDAACDGSGACQIGPPLACDDGNPYTTDWCEPSSGCLHWREAGPIGDCNGDAVVNVNELVTMVDDALGESPGMSCPAGDANLDQRITIDEIVAATKNAMNAPCDLCDDP